MSFVSYLRQHRRSPSTMQARVFATAVVLLLCSYPYVAASTGVDADTLVYEANIARFSSGARALHWHPLLTAAAQQRAQELVAHGAFAHTRPNGTPFATAVQSAGYTYHIVGENLAIDHLDARAATAAWLTSASHRTNLLNPAYEDIGIGVASGRIDGAPVLITVELYGKRADRMQWHAITWRAHTG